MYRLFCLLGLHSWQTFYEEMKVKARPDDIYPTHVQFDKCRHCMQIRAMAVNPDNTLSDLSVPSPINNERILATGVSK